jgi:Carboxypeptidase regulatory-like domain/Calcineurin-like phosphoesterase/Bacterial Ig domain/Concanavalin A-like lectin/glucanases superfamily
MTTSRLPRRTPRRPPRSLGLALSLPVLLVLLLAVPVPARADAPPCATTNGSTFAVQVCLTQPAPGATLTGSVPVTATATVVSGTIRVTRVTFTIDGGYTLTDFANPRTFKLPSTRWIDGPHTLAAYAVLSDQSTTASATETVTFSNGVSSVGGSTGTPTITSGTTPASGAPLVLAAVGDGASDETSAANVAGTVASWSPNLFLYLGDVYEKGSYSEFSNWYESTYGSLRPVTNPVVGNHEYGTSKAQGYFTYWNNEPNYYSFDAGGWHFIALNSTSQLQSAGGWSGQLSWLKADLAQHAGACTIAYWHHPLYSVGEEGPTARSQDLWAPLASAGATLVLNGHDHDYQRWQALDGAGNPSAAGVTEVVAGTGGHSSQGIIGSDSRVVSAAGNVFGASKLLLSRYSAQVQFYKVSAAGATLFDNAAIPCRGYGTVSGTVRDGRTGQPLAGATVSLGQASVTTASSGAYTIGHAPLGSGALTVTASGYASQSIPITVNPAATTQADVQLQPQAGSLTGVVTDALSGLRIANATVTYASGSATTDQNGTYNLTGVAAGTYSVTASAPGYVSQTQTVTVATGAATNLDFVLSGGQGTISDGFESGSMVGWTNAGVSIQSSNVHSGSYAAEASSSSGMPSYARKTLPSARSSMYYRVYSRAITAPSSTATIIGCRTASGGSLARIYMDGQGRLALRNDVAGTSTVGPMVGAGAWHSVEMHLVINGTSSTIEVWLDGNPVATLTTSSANLGTIGVGAVQIGEHQSGRNFDFAIDDVVIQDGRIGP